MAERASSTAVPGGEGALALLREIERRSRDHGQAPPRRHQQRDQWDGVVFQVGERHYAARLDEVREILNLPAILTPVPGTKDWVRGVANVRGVLLPIVDLKQFLGDGPTRTSRRSRVLVIEREGILTGLLVGRHAGMRHFSERERQSLSRDELAGLYGPYVRGLYVQGETKWPLFDIQALVEDPEFLVAAA